MHICKKCKHWVSAKTKNHVCGVKTKINDYRSPVVVPPTPKKTVTDDYNDGLDLIEGVALGIGIASLFSSSDDSSNSSDSSDNSSSSDFGGFDGGDFGGGGSSGDW